MTAVKSYFLRAGQLISHEQDWYKEYSSVSMAKQFHRVPCFQIWSDRLSTRYGHYTYLGFKDVSTKTMPKKLRMYLLLLGVQV